MKEYVKDEEPFKFEQLKSRLKRFRLSDDDGKMCILSLFQQSLIFL